jgi:hypothetical protein
MLTKILLTTAVIVAVVLYLRTQTPAATAPRPKEEEIDPAAQRRARNIATGAILLILIGIGSLVYYFKWVEEHQLVVVQVINSATDSVATYTVFANKVQGRTFVTKDGRTITLADVERMEVQPLEE